MLNVRNGSFNSIFTIDDSALPQSGSKVPRNAAHKRTRISRHEVNTVDRCRFVSQLRFECKYGLFPLRVEQILNEQERFQTSMGQLDRQLIALRKIEVNPGGRFDAPVLYERPCTEIRRLQLRRESFRPS